MIFFKSVRWRNFLSTGDNWTEIDLTRSNSTLVVGQNGAGKSTLLDAISFALFGKPHRNINKPQLVNSINQKACEVEVDFTIGKNTFRVARGIKPNKFEIWKNQSLINQSSHAKDYQRILEQNIIKLNHKSFHQIIVLGSSSFTPFMQLPAQHRREVIEDLLDINIFSKMNMILKEKNAVLKDKIKDINYQLDVLDNKIVTQKKYIRDINQINQEEIESKKLLIEKNQSEINEIQLKNEELNSCIDGKDEIISNELKKVQTKKQELFQYNTQFKQTVSSLVKDVKFFEENDTCPTCTQEIDETTRKEKIDSAKEKAKKLNDALVKAKEKEADLEEKYDSLSKSLEKIREKQIAISTNIKQISVLQRNISSIEEDVNRLTSKEGDIKIAEDELQDLTQEKLALGELKLTRNEEFTYNLAMSEMLKDTGIKTKVIKQYLPVINKLVNSYLQVLDFFVHFDLNESFQETIRSRHRDSFSYDSFSEGEKQRIDLALLFTWRQIAKMKNSVATNLLILDETFDSSLDHDGVENLMKILSTLDDNTNVFVISHKGDILDGKFDAKIEFYKDKNFSKIK